MTDTQAETIISLLTQLLSEIRGEKKAPPAKEVLLNNTQAAEIVGVTRQTIGRYIREGRLKKVCRGGKMGIPLSSLSAE